MGEAGREEGSKNRMDQFWLERTGPEIVSGRDRQVIFLRIIKRVFRKGQCLLCPGYDRLLCYTAFRRHMQRYHLPSEPCSKCGETFRPLEVKQHQEECLALRGTAAERGVEDKFRVS